MTKPSRSDEVLDADQQMKIANQIRAQFDSVAPKRPIKPNRSEPDPDHSNHADSESDDTTIPELHKFQSLQSQSAPLQQVEAVETVQDEFVETQYYNQLDSIDKQHHTTGTGFIRLVREDGDEVKVQAESPASIAINGGIGNTRAGFRSNPATNDWVPSFEDQVFVSSKPNRSESST